MKTYFLILMLLLISCNKKEKKILTKQEEFEFEYKYELEELNKEKIALFSIIHQIDENKLSEIIANFEAKTDYDSNSDYIKQVIDTISKKSNFPKQKVAKIIFNYKYNLFSKYELEEEYIKNFELVRDDDYEPSIGRGW